MRDIKGFEGKYAITSCGKVWSYKMKAFRKTQLDKDGYERITLHGDGGKTYRYGVHRLVAEAYIDNPEGKPTVNHKDEVKTNNWVGNLEWATMAEQNAHGTRVQRMAETQSKPVRCIETGETYGSIKEAAAAINVAVQSLSKHLNGHNHTCAGRHWEFIS